MGPRKFDILFDNNVNRVYYAGQYISGKVILDYDSEKKIRGVVVKVKGEAEVRWTETRTTGSGENRRTETIVYQSEETYMNHKMNVFGALGGNSEVVLPAGAHEFFFNCQIPFTAPSSFEGQWGHVRYTVRAVVDRPWKFDNETKLAFTVICPFDLNNQPHLAEPVLNSIDDYFGCCCCISGPIRASFSLSSGGAVPGQTLMATLDVENGSTVKLLGVKLKLVKRARFHARGKTREVETNVVDKMLGSLGANDNHAWENEQLTIPSLPPSNLSNCHIIDIDYYVQATLNPSGCHSTRKIPLPLVLGTIPLYRQFANCAPTPDTPVPTAPPPNGWNFAPSAPAQDDDKPPAYLDLPPPTFEESCMGSHDIREEGDSDYLTGDRSYTPRYPVYGFHVPK